VSLLNLLHLLTAAIGPQRRRRPAAVAAAFWGSAVAAGVALMYDNVLYYGSRTTPLSRRRTRRPPRPRRAGCGPGTPDTRCSASTIPASTASRSRRFHRDAARELMPIAGAVHSRRACCGAVIGRRLIRVLLLSEVPSRSMAAVCSDKRVASPAPWCSCH
jgi:hypothetical protein